MPLLLAALLAIQVAGESSARQARPDSAVRPDSTARGGAAHTAQPARPDSTDSTRTPRGRRSRPAPRRLAVTPALAASAFADPSARDLLLRARAARLRQDSALLSYDATTYQRLSVGLGFRRFARDRLLLRSETASRVRWQRGVGVWLEPTGQRAVFPIAKEAESEFDAVDFASIPYFPGREALWFPSSNFGTVRAEVDDREMVHPIATGAEAYYRYATGDSVTLQLPGGRRILLRELRITARRPEWKLFVGSFWFDVGTGDLVRAAYRMAAEMDIWQVAEEETERENAELRAAGKEPHEDDDVPTWVKGMLNPMRGTISAITVEYGLFEGRFWLPKANVAEGNAQAGFMRLPFRMEERFSYASVNGRDSLPALPLARRSAADSAHADSAHADSARADSADRSVAFADEWADEELADDTTADARVTLDLTGSPGGAGSGASSLDSAIARHRARADSLGRVADSLAAKGDTANARDVAARAGRARRRAARLRSRQRACAHDSTYVRGVESRYNGQLRVAVRMPCDSTRLARSPDLPGSIYDPGEELFDEGARDELVKALDLSLQPGWGPQRPQLVWGLGMLRYNRIEGLSAGVGARQVLGRGYTAATEARLGVADLQPNGELSIERGNGRTSVRAGVYRRLAVANDWGSPLSFGSSLSALLYGRDEGFYYRTWGAELAGSRERWGAVADWRLFAERHDSARVETQFSLGHLVNSNTRFLPNIQAREGVVAGAATALHRSFGIDPDALRLVTDLRLEGAAGDFDYTRAALDATISRRLGGHLAGALTASGGTSGGALPAQRLWYLGGLRTVRGQVAGTAAGNAFWLGRAELGTKVVSARPVLFYDVGWAGDRTLWRHPGQPLSGAGIGASFLDGLVRFDLARGIQPRQLIRFDMYVEARF